MAKKTEEVVITSVEVIKKEAALVGASLIQQSKSLTTVATEFQYEVASGIRTSLGQAQTTFVSRLRVIIDPAYKALQGLYTLQKELVGPLESEHKRITALMKGYKEEELRKVRLEERRREEEKERLEKEAEDKRRSAEAAQTKAMQIRLTNQAVKLEEKLEAVEAAPAPKLASSVGTGQRVTRKWRVKDLRKILQGVLDEEIPDDIILIDSAKMNAYFRMDEAAVSQFPGIEIYEDVTITQKRGI